MLERDRCHSLSFRLIRKTDGCELSYLSWDLSRANVALGDDLIEEKGSSVLSGVILL